MERKKKYTVEEAAAIILRDVPLDNAVNTDMESESDDLDISNMEVDRVPLEEHFSEYEESFSEHEESISEYEQSSSEQECASEYEEINNDDQSSSSAASNDNANQTDPVDSTQGLMNSTASLTQNYKVDQNRAWQKKKKSELNVPFDSPQGPVMDHFVDCSNEGDFFLKFVDAEIREKIIYETNLYISQKHKRISPLTERELYSFLGINILMSYHTLPSLTCYWNNSQDFNVPLVSNAMPRNRFSQILSNLHLNDNSAI